MRLEQPGAQLLPHSVEGAQWIVGAVAYVSIAIFIVLGAQVVPAALIATAARPSQPYIAPFILSIALVLLAWRRSVDLKKSAAARNQAEQRANDLVYKDDITGLFNRRYLTETIKASASSKRLALLLIDIDHFKKVNDLYGHAAGDELLLEISDRIRTITPGGSICARLGGDEFAVLLSGAAAETDSASVIAGKLVEALNRPIKLDTTIARVGGSLGLSAMSSSNEDRERLLRQADIAMYEAKRLGRNCYVWFDKEMELQLEARNLIEAEMRESLVQGNFVPYFQPTLDLASGEITGFEVLARWEHPTRGIVEPNDFIPLAEATGLISELSFAVMRSALTHALSWPDYVTIAVNISPVQFKDPLLAQRIIKLLTEVGFPARRLELEITEGAIMDDRNLALSTVESLKNYGIRISLDDFGTGYASLSQLRELPFDRIKIDKSFVAGLLEDRQSNAIVHAIATLGQSLELPITAEGVETEKIYERLQELGCSDAQGWLFGKAVPALKASEVFLDQGPGNQNSARSAAGRRAAGHS